MGLEIAPNSKIQKLIDMNYRTQRQQTAKQNGVKGYEAEPLEGEIKRLMAGNGKVELDARSETIYTERKDGVINHYNIRNDKWEEWADTMDKAAELHGMQREARIGERDYEKWDKEKQREFNKKFPNNKHALAEKQGGDL